MSHVSGQRIRRWTAAATIAFAILLGSPAMAAPASQATFAPLSQQEFGFALVDVASVRRNGDTAEVAVLRFGPSYEDEAGYRATLSRYSIDCRWGAATVMTETEYLNGAAPRSLPPTFRGPVFYWSNSGVGEAAGLACAPIGRPMPTPTVTLASALELAKETYPLSVPSPVPAIPPVEMRPAPAALAPVQWGPRLGWSPELLLALRDGERAVFVDRSQIVRREGVVQIVSLWVGDAGRRGSAQSYALRTLVFSCANDTARMTREVIWRYESSGTGNTGASGMMSTAASRPLAALRKAACEELPPGAPWNNLRQAVDALTPNS